MPDVKLTWTYLQRVLDGHPGSKARSQETQRISIAARLSRLESPTELKVTEGSESHSV